MTSDGSCQFSSIALQCASTPSRVRAQIVQWMREHPHSKNDEPFWAFEEDFWTTYNSWEEYCNQMAKPLTWGNEISLIAFAEATGCAVFVFALEAEKDYCYYPTTRKETNEIIQLAHIPEIHYCAVTPFGILFLPYVINCLLKILMSQIWQTICVECNSKILKVVL